MCRKNRHIGDTSSTDVGKRADLRQEATCRTACSTGNVPRHWVATQHSREMQQELRWIEATGIEASGVRLCEAEVATDGGSEEGLTGRRAGWGVVWGTTTRATDGDRWMGRTQVHRERKRAQKHNEAHSRVTIVTGSTHVWEKLNSMQEGKQLWRKHQEDWFMTWKHTRTRTSSTERCG